jgi:hypothetical protein
VKDIDADACGAFIAEAALRLSMPRTAASTMHPKTKERLRKWNLKKFGNHGR